MGFLDFFPFLMFLQSFLGSLTNDIIFALVLIVIGVIIIILVKILLVFIPAIIVALLVWLLTGSIFWAGIAFLVIALLSLLGRL